MSAFVTAPFSSSTGTIPGVSTLASPRGVPCSATDFTDVLRDVSAPEQTHAATDLDAAIPLSELMHMLLLLEVMGLPAPRWMIDAFRAHGMPGLAESLEVRNVQLEAQRVEELRLQHRREGLT